MTQLRNELTSAIASEEVYCVRREVACNRFDVESSLKLSIAVVVNLTTPNKGSNRFGIQTRAKIDFQCQIKRWPSKTNTLNEVVKKRKKKLSFKRSKLQWKCLKWNRRREFPFYASKKGTQLGYNHTIAFLLYIFHIYKHIYA